METIASNYYAHNIEVLGYHDLEGRPAFKIAMHEANGRYYLYTGNLWHRGCRTGIDAASNSITPTASRLMARLLINLRYPDFPGGLDTLFAPTSRYFQPIEESRDYADIAPRNRPQRTECPSVL